MNFANLPLFTQVFLGIVISLTLYFHVKYDQKTLTYGPTILTTTGIFATFLGIALGLADFDTSNIQASVPDLLDGLKTAFWASVAGVGGALTIKLRHFFVVPQKQDITNPNNDDEITASDLAKLLQSIQQALVGNDDSTLISQLKLSRQDSNDRLDALKKSQQESLLKLSEMGSKALIEALRDVINDFNTKLTEQFGENFKQLNDAVGKLLIWQEQYKTYIETSTDRHTQILNSMVQASDDYNQLVNDASRFSDVASDLSGILTVLETQKDHLNTMLYELVQLIQSARGGLPEIENKVMELTAQLIHSTETNQKQINKSLTENSELIRETIQGVGKDLNTINHEFNKYIGELTDKTNKQVSVLDAALTEELTKSLESLGRQLTSLSEKFVNDYSPLTDKLRDVVNLAKRVS